MYPSVLFNSKCSLRFLVFFCFHNKGAKNFILVFVNVQIKLNFRKKWPPIPDESGKGFVQEVHLPHQDVGGFGSLRDLLHEVQIGLGDTNKLET